MALVVLYSEHDSGQEVFFSPGSQDDVYRDRPFLMVCSNNCIRHSFGLDSLTIGKRKLCFTSGSWDSSLLEM